MEGFDFGTECEKSGLGEYSSLGIGESEVGVTPDGTKVRVTRSETGFEFDWNITDDVSDEPPAPEQLTSKNDPEFGIKVKEVAWKIPGKTPKNEPAVQMSALEQMKTRKEHLEEVSRKLKEHFVGTDESIDKIIASITAWYCMPNVLTRPTIVCLWGLTGVGKTDLVRKLISYLNMNDNFVEIQMTNKGSTSHVYESTIQSLLSSSNINSEEQGVLLLDEFQRFRSVDEQGKEIHDYKFQDIWMLLSDGNFGNNSHIKEELLEIIYRGMYYEQNALDAAEASNKPTEEANKSKYKFKQSYWEAKNLKKTLDLNEDLDEIMTWDSSKKIKVVLEKMEDKTAYKEKIYKKLLIFVSGNLDEAYRMADDTDEVDIDADIFHQQTKRLNVLSIKGSLTRRFKPEQIARLGNCHIIYPSLNKRSYEEIIQRKVGSIVDQIYNQNNVRIVVDQTVYDALYRNGVFPVQGTRPIFSTISSFFESSLPHFVFNALLCDVVEITLTYSDNHLRSVINGNEITLKIEGDIDRIVKDNKNVDFTAKLAVHEAGHAVAYALLFGVAPIQISVNSASNDKNGFVNLHSLSGAKSQLLNMIAVYLAGRVAEELVFGPDEISSGNYHDLDAATRTATTMVRGNAMYDFSSKIVNGTTQGADSYNNDAVATNDVIERVVGDQEDFCINLLTKNAKLLADVSGWLIQNNKPELVEFVEIFKQHGLDIKIVDSKQTIYPKYSDMFATFESKVIEGEFSEAE